MKLLLLTTLLTLNFSSFADEDGIFGLNQLTNKDCKLAYREAYLSLKEESTSFNLGNLDAQDYAFAVTKLSAKARATRTVCRVFENPENKWCVYRYQKRYEKLRSNVKVAALMAGTQNHVEIPKIDQALFQAIELRCNKD